MNYPLRTINNHSFLELDGALWLLDTGAPQSFGRKPHLTLAGESFHIAEDYMGFTADTLSNFVSVSCHGLIGADVLNSFDMILDQLGETIQISTDELELHGTCLPLPLEFFLGIPIVTIQIGSRNYRMFFDTGAQISYFQHESLTSYPQMDSLEDFYSGFGQFTTPIHSVPIVLGNSNHTLRFGQLPQLLAATLSLANTHGIVGNELVMGRKIGYFPRRGMLIIGEY